jgi:hypothetical protein
MFERIGRLAEKTADGLSRRAFLTRMGLGALAMATFVTGARAGPVITCVKNGGCCGGAYPYQYVADGTPLRCCKTATCGPWYTCAACSASTCCGGSGACLAGSTCYQNHGCNAPTC